MAKKSKREGQIEIISCLEAFQKKFIQVHFDRASSNVAIICKQYFVEVIFKEMLYEMEIKLTAKLMKVVIC